jgi:hypothetical protein
MSFNINDSGYDWYENLLPDSEINIYICDWRLWSVNYQNCD